MIGGSTLTATSSWAPWYPPSNLPILSLPVNALAARMAFSVPSVPEFTKRTLSIEGIRSTMISPHLTTSSDGAGKDSPRAACSVTAFTTAGWECPRIRVVMLLMRSTLA